jgi:hypothetical protein
MTKEQLLVEVEDLLRTMPPKENEDLAWTGRCYAVLEQWAWTRPLLTAEPILKELAAASSMGRLFGVGYRTAVILLHRAVHDLRIQTAGPSAVAIPRGNTFDYFDEVRRIIELAKIDLFFIDPYLDAEFVARYFPHAAKGAKIRLLTRNKIGTLLPAVEAFCGQYGAQVEIRSAPGFHDRYIIIDECSCYQSGASFKDGAKSSPTTLTQITDAFDAVYRTYQDIWVSAKKER